MPDPKGFPSLRRFRDSVNSAKYTGLLPRAETKVAHEDAFAEMKGHILNLYEKTDARNSFMDESGAIWDCIPIEQQPALRGSKGSVPRPRTPLLRCQLARRPLAARMKSGRSIVLRRRLTPTKRTGMET